MKKNSPQKIGSILHSVLTEGGYQDQGLEAMIRYKWTSIMGQKASQETECTSVRDGVVYIRVNSSSWRNEIYFLKKAIIRNIKKNIKHSEVKDIIFC